MTSTRSRVVDDKISLPRSHSIKTPSETFNAAIIMTAIQNITPPLPSSYVDAIRESCRELREAQNIQVSGYATHLYAYQNSIMDYEHECRVTIELMR